MDQRITIGSGVTLDRPIHRACVVPGCWCGATTMIEPRTATTAREPASSAPAIRRTGGASADLTGIALGCVGLPVA